MVRQSLQTSNWNALLDGQQNITFSCTWLSAGSLFNLAEFLFQMCLAFVWSLFMLFHSSLSKVQVDWLSEAIATTKPAPSPWDETTWQLQLFLLLLFLLLKSHTTNYSARSHFYNCVCFWITACRQLRHGISVSNLLQGAVWKPQVLVKGYTRQYHFGIKSTYLVTPSLLNFNVIFPASYRFPAVRSMLL